MTNTKIIKSDDPKTPSVPTRSALEKQTCAPYRATKQATPVRVIRPSSKVFLPIFPSFTSKELVTFASRSSLFFTQHQPRIRALSLSKSFDYSDAAAPSPSSTIQIITAKDTSASWPLIPESCGSEESSSKARPRLAMRISSRWWIIIFRVTLTSPDNLVCIYDYTPL